MTARATRWLLMTTALGALLGCELPWELIETGSLEDRYVAIHNAPQELILATNKGRFLRRAQGQRTMEEVSVLDTEGHTLSGEPVLGLTPGPDGDLYAWTPRALLRRTTGSFVAAPPPEDATGRSLARSWLPLAALSEGNRMFVATQVGNGPAAVRLLLSGTAVGSWQRAEFSDGTPHDVTWLARAPNGSLWAGDGRADARTMFELVGGVWTPRDDAAVADVTQTVLTADRLVQLNTTGVRISRRSTPSVLDGDLSLPARVHAACALPDGRVVAVASADFPAFPLWILQDNRWANINTGTRAALYAVFCDADGRILAAGDSGVAIAQR